MRLLVTLGTDGTTNWVRTPDGQRFNLGSVSALAFVTKLALGGAKNTRKALDDFLQGKEVLLQVDDDKMWDLLTPRRLRWAADSFILCDHRKRGNGMTTIDKDLGVLEAHVAKLHEAAKANISPEKMKEGTDILVRLAKKVASQSDNSRYYGLEELEETPMEESVDQSGDFMSFDEVGDLEPDVVAVEDVDQVRSGTTVKLAYDTYKANSTVANRILDQMEAVNGRINELITAGKFNSKRAKADIHTVTSKVANIVNDVDLTTSWVAEDLAKLATRAEHLHGLFFPVK